ncbi:MAG: syringomycin synthesis regulator SyrP [Woeseiaceae bacterium]|nr:syringomycin synthesis regulator SyrP [Woeseiaceae bacterium]
MSTAAKLASPLPGVIEPRWAPDTPVLDVGSYAIDASRYSMDPSDAKALTALSTRMNQVFDDVGLIWLQNTGLTDLQTMRKIAKLVVENEMRYEGGANPRDDLEPNVYEVGAPLSAWLHYHHEMAYVSHSTRLLAFLGYKALASRGATYVSDNLQATDAILATDFGQKLKELGLCYHRNLTDRDYFDGRDPVGVYNHWQKSMLTDDPDVAIETARSRGLEVEWGPNRLLKTRYYVSAFEYFPQLDRNVLYSSVADDGMWFDTWPKVMHLPYSERPLALTFGDGSEMSREEKQQFVDVYDRFGIKLDWSVGDVLIVCNFRFAHGRPRVNLQPGEERELGVLIGEAYQRAGHRDGKW